MSKSRPGKSYPTGQSKTNRIKSQDSSTTEGGSSFSQLDNPHIYNNDSNVLRVGKSKVLPERSITEQINTNLGLILTVIGIISAVITIIWWLLSMRYDLDSVKNDLNKQDVKLEKHEKTLQLHTKKNTQNELKIDFNNQQIQKNTEDIKSINDAIMEKSKTQKK